MHDFSIFVSIAFNFSAMSHMDLETGLGDFRSLSRKFHPAGCVWAQYQGFATPVNSCLSIPPETSGPYWSLQWLFPQSHRTKETPVWGRAPRQGTCSQLNYLGVAGCCMPAPAPSAAAPPAVNPQLVLPMWSSLSERGSAFPFPSACACDCCWSLSSSLQPLSRP